MKKESSTMKKSRSIRLVLLGGAGVYSESVCLDAKTQSEKDYLAQAPRFSRKEECEKEFGAGNCETPQAASTASSGGTGFFMPMMMGYMLGNMMGGGGNRFNAPVYRGVDNSAVMARNGKFMNVGSFAGAGARSATAFRPATQMTPVSRSGFGSTAASYRTSSGS
jgi:uncharacterized protein YgiB involved in biofilm formation